MVAKLYGLHRSGTNATAYLLERAIPGLVCYHNHPNGPIRGHGFKHGHPVALDGMDIYVLCVKDIWAWFPSVVSYRTGSRGKRAPTLTDAVAEWAAWCLAARAFAEPSVTVHHRDLVGRPASVVELVAAAFGVDPDMGAAHTPDTRMGRSGIVPGEHIVSSETFDRTYYTDRRYADGWRPADVATVLRLVPPELADWMGPAPRPV